MIRGGTINQAFMIFLLLTGEGSQFLSTLPYYIHANVYKSLKPSIITFITIPSFHTKIVGISMGSFSVALDLGSLGKFYGYRSCILVKVRYSECVLFHICCCC